MTTSRARIETVIDTVEQRGDVLIFDLLPQAGTLPPWQAGAHIDLFLDDDLVRQYSLCGDPADRARYRLGVLLEPQGRGGSRAVHDRVRPGATLAIGAPRNLFPLDTGHRGEALLVGGGIGVTPLIAMAHTLTHANQRFTLHYVARDPVFTPLLAREGFAAQVQIHDRSQPDTPRFDPHAAIAAAIARNGGASELCVYSCGPVGLMDAVAEAALALGLTPEQIHREAFSALPVENGGSFEVLAAKSGVRVTVAADEPITAALARAGVKVRVNCEQGICGTCVATVLEGEPDHRDEYLTEDERTDQIALCCSRALSPLLVVDL